MADQTNPNAERFRIVAGDASAEGFMGASSVSQGGVTHSAALAPTPPLEPTTLRAMAASHERHCRHRDISLPSSIVLALLHRVETTDNALDYYVAQRKELQSTLEFVTDRMDEFAYEEMSVLILDERNDQWGESCVSKPDVTTARAIDAEKAVAAVR